MAAASARRSQSGSRREPPPARASRDAETTASSGHERCGPSCISEGQWSDTVGSRKGGPASLPALQVVLHVLLAELDERPAAANVVPHAGGKAAARAQNGKLVIRPQVLNDDLAPWTCHCPLLL